MIKYNGFVKVLFNTDNKVFKSDGELIFTSDVHGKTLTIGCGNVCLTVAFDEVYQLIKKEMLDELDGENKHELKVKLS